MGNAITLPREWTCDGRESKPRSGASASNTWLFDGKEIKPKSGASSSNTWVTQKRTPAQEILSWRSFLHKHCAARDLACRGF
jgi:hypothetical protein